MKGITTLCIILGLSLLTIHAGKISGIDKKANIAGADAYLVAESAEAVVERQVKAFNARDLNGFLATYAEDIKIFNPKDTLIINGHDQLRKRFDEIFKNNPHIHCTIEQRIVINNKVIDKEIVKMEKDTLRGVSVYEVEEGKIKKVRYVY